ncbi:MAG: 2-dehydro-3-deoxygalactonokinase [Rhizobacter sp.]|nr:2-dehydro-3-deoxygalactonokinase [Rhizobacter sp.]
MSRLVAVDWGSSSLRAALLDEHGTVLDLRSSDEGMLKVETAGFDAVFEAAFGDWMDVPGTRCLMAGMVGSRQGWVEAPYVACPCGRDDFVARLQPIGGASAKRRDVAIVPGASCVVDGVPDLLRGEEVKAIGVLELLGTDSAVVLSPGTHSKWMTLDNGRLVRFSTAMSGEFYALLRQHSILGRGLPPEGDDALDVDAFDAGVRRAVAACGLLETAFGVRTRALFGELPAKSLASYLSGLVIGEELRCRPLAGVRSVALVGSAALTERYARALATCGVDVRVFDEAAVWRGLCTIDRVRRARHGAPR